MTRERTLIDGPAADTEDAVKRNQQGTVYKITKLICGKYQAHANTIIKDKQGSLLMTQREREQEEHWTEHLREILNRLPPTEDANIPEAADDLDIITAVPEKEQIIKAIKSLKNGKAPGHDNLNAQLFKADPQLAATILQPLLAAIWEGEEVPADWRKGVIIRIPKKGALGDFNNWHGITLLSVPNKILARSSSSGSQILLTLA